MADRGCEGENEEVLNQVVRGTRGDSAGSQSKTVGDEVFFYDLAYS